MTSRTIILSANRGFALANSRGFLIRHFIDQGWRVVAATVPDEHTQTLENWGVRIVSVPFTRGGNSPRQDFTALKLLRQLYAETQPQLIQHFNAKPVLLGTMAAASCRSNVVFNTITGLGHAFIKRSPSRWLASLGYRLLLSRSRQVIFQNSDDLALFEHNRWVSGDMARLIVSSGVDTNRFRSSPRLSWEDSPVKKTLRVLMVGRLIWQKGVGEYIAAARALREKHPHVQFQLAGEWDAGHPDAVPEEYIRKCQADGSVEFVGFLSDMDQVLQEIDLLVLPSYREGAPRVLLEAGACGVPVVTTDAPGCREVVIPGKTGVLVPVRDSHALAEAMDALLADRQKRELMGQQARLLMERQFDLRAITQQYLDVYRQAGIDVGEINIQADTAPWRKSA